MGKEHPGTDRRTEPLLGDWLHILEYIVQGHRARFVLCLLFGLATNSFVSAANPLALKYLFDEGIIKGDFYKFVAISLAFVAIFTLWRVAVFLYRISVQGLKNEVLEQHALQMLGRFYRLSYEEILRRDRGYFLSRIYDEVASASSLVIDTTLSFSNMVISLIVAFSVAAAISFRATLMVMLAVPVVYLLSRKYSGKIKAESKIEKEEEAKVRGVLDRTVSSYKTARIFGLEPAARTKVHHQLGGFISAFFTRFKTSARYQMLSGIFMSYVETIAILSAGYEIVAGRMTFGGFMGFMSAFWAVMGAVRGIFGLVPEISRARGLVERLGEFTSLQPNRQMLLYGDGVRLEKVSFAYDGEDVFSEFDFTSVRGERILIVGPNGCGKSTLAHLISGLLRPTGGTTTTLPLERISAAILPHEFIPGSVRDNLSFVEPSRTRELAHLSQMLNVADLLDKDTQQLSAGQRKRIEILMVLLKKAELYIIDEPLSGIDMDSRKTVMSTIFTATKGKNIIVIMHGGSEFYPEFNRVLDLTQTLPRDTIQNPSFQKSRVLL